MNEGKTRPEFPHDADQSICGGETMFLRHGIVLAAGLCGGLAALAGPAVTRAAEPHAVRPAIYRSSSTATVAHVGYRHYGGYGAGYRPYGAYYGGYGYQFGSPYYRSMYLGPNYAFGYSSPYANSPYGRYGIYGYNFHRPWYTHPMGYWRYGYYSYPTYRMYGYPYSYNGFYPSSYYGGFYPNNPGAAIINMPTVNANVSPPMVTSPFIYGGFYSYPMYGVNSVHNYGCCW
jgi:hypothetical protein